MTLIFKPHIFKQIQVTLLKSKSHETSNVMLVKTLMKIISESTNETQMKTLM